MKLETALGRSSRPCVAAGLILVMGLTFFDRQAAATPDELEYFHECEARITRNSARLRHCKWSRRLKPRRGQRKIGHRQIACFRFVDCAQWAAHTAWMNGLTLTTS